MAACNVMLDPTHMVIPAACERLGAELSKRGVEPVPVDITNHAPFGAGLRCMTGVILRDID